MTFSDIPINNDKYTCLTFKCSSPSTLIHGSSPSTLIHGFAGYFDTVLYKDITLSE